MKAFSKFKKCIYFFILIATTSNTLEIYYGKILPSLTTQRSGHFNLKRFYSDIHANRLETRATRGFGSYAKKSPSKILVNNSETLTFFQKMARLANIPYCQKMDKIGSGQKKIIGDIILEENMEILGYFRGPEFNKKQWDRRKSEFRKPILIAKDWLVDANWAKVFASVKGPFARVSEKIVEYSKKIKDDKIKINLTGHGIGGVYALYIGIFLHFLQEDFYKKIPGRHLYITVVTFGQPRAGNDKFAKLINSLRTKINVYRVTNRNDFVPHYPKTSSNGRRYWHYEREYWISDDDCNCATKPNPIDPKSFALYECPGYFSKDSNAFGENMNCNLATVSESALAHFGPYFGTTFGNCENFYPLSSV
ncbi:hypothetical protein G9A89_020885 [Geosiphon pyriformis]|nr:hypothetical protein G9A89_020885 [Geosiphon pyriformis]